MMQKQNMIVVNQKKSQKYLRISASRNVSTANERTGQFVHIKVAEGIAPLLRAQLVFVM